MTHSIRAALLLTVILLAACGGKEDAPAAADSAATADSTAPGVALNVAPTMIAVVDTSLVETGPSLSGTLAAERIAQLRAQVPGTIVRIMVEEGASVGAGQALAQIEATVLDEQVRSATSQLRSAEASAAVAARNAQRAQQLNTAGAVAERDLEAARNQEIAANAMVDDARSRLAAARKQLANATVRAPFRGVVSERTASEGDVAQMGTAILTVVDPTTLELAATVPAAALATLRRGVKVEFTVTGYPDRRFSGTVARVNPTVDPVTRQARIYVSVPNRDGALASGVFAEGRVATGQARGLAVPLNALDPAATAPSVRRIKGGKVELVPVSLGLRDDIAERIEVKSGLQRGDTVLVAGGIGTPVGSVVRVTRADS